MSAPDDKRPMVGPEQEAELTRRRQAGWRIEPRERWADGEISVEGTEPGGGAFYGRVTVAGALIVEADEDDLAEAAARWAVATGQQ
jgi:hypothetical protein